jgi:hypothetical protein
MGGFVVTTVYGFSRPTGDLDVLEIAPRDAARAMLELGMRGSALHKKYKIHLDRWRGACSGRLRTSAQGKYFQEASSIFGS